jgi:hypothetical protein
MVDVGGFFLPEQTNLQHTSCCKHNPYDLSFSYRPVYAVPETLLPEGVSLWLKK